ncbi:AzlD family protein [Rhizobium oryzicola]|uniref:AzlD family protein n=1 Tax=Rhizobium oryzicola TaxID=1232668 RepID=A0ABT8T1F7_9HYPH|nr:AzlD family protein [Rhizobium oryzicola]MDO1584476.1 AzlD family protein [Rhizobium oryzicola]
MTTDLRTLLIILAAALATYATRIGGYVMITRMKTIPPRLERALNAVPGAVLATLVAPAFFDGGWDVKAALIVALLVGLRHAGFGLIIAGWGTAVLIRHFA